MGTRHTVKVIKNGQVVLNQYGQWDGNTATAGIYLVHSIKKLGVDRLKEMFECVKVSSEDPDEFFCGESLLGVKRDGSDMEGFIDNLYQGKKPTIRKIVRALIRRFGTVATARYVMISRNTGYKILDALDELLKQNVAVKTFICKDKCYWHYEINLDEETFTVKVGNKEKAWKLNRLPSDKTLDHFEDNID